MNIKKERKRKKDNLENLLESTQDILDNVFLLLEEAMSDYKKYLKSQDVLITANILQKMAKEMGKSHIDFMGMS